MIRHREDRPTIMDAEYHLDQAVTLSSGQHLSKTDLDLSGEDLSVRCVTEYRYIIPPYRQRTPATTSFCSRRRAQSGPTQCVAVNLAAQVFQP